MDGGVSITTTSIFADLTLARAPRHSSRTADATGIEEISGMVERTRSRR